MESRVDINHCKNRGHLTKGSFHEEIMRATGAQIRLQVHPEDNQGANLWSISHSYYPILVACVWELTQETIE